MKPELMQNKSVCATPWPGTTSPCTALLQAHAMLLPVGSPSLVFDILTEMGYLLGVPEWLWTYKLQRHAPCMRGRPCAGHYHLLLLLLGQLQARRDVTRGQLTFDLTAYLSRALSTAALTAPESSCGPSAAHTDCAGVTRPWLLSTAARDPSTAVLDSCRKAARLPMAPSWLCFGATAGETCGSWCGSWWRLTASAVQWYMAVWVTRTTQVATQHNGMSQICDV